MLLFHTVTSGFSGQSGSEPHTSVSLEIQQMGGEWGSP